MKLKPSLKEKKRYILFEIVSDQNFNLDEVKAEAEKAWHTFLGDLGVAKAAPLFVKEKYKNNKFIIKVSNKHTDEIKSALILIKKIKNTPVIIKSILTSGTIKKLSSL